MKTNIARGGLAVIAFPLLGGCSLVFGNSIDFDAAKDQIRDKLNSEYQKLGVAVDSISCDQSESNPKTGDSFMCTAKVNDAEIPVKVTVQDDTTYAVNFVTTKKLVNLDKVGAMIAPDVSAKLRTRVTIDCGKGLKALEPGESFRCSAKDSDGGTGVLTYTIGKMDGADEWKIG